MDLQMAFNVVLAIAGFLGGWWMKAMRESLRDLRDEDKLLADKVNRIEVLVAGEYVKRDDFDKVATALFVKLDKIHDKLESKADRSGL